ncbi:MAG: DUF4037 domain-containing protein [bacterium]|nr:DUF4037 domain-containing protein [bacterium]
MEEFGMSGTVIKGLELSERFYEEAVRPMLSERVPALHERWAAGLVGHGSECYGYDDAFSADHDYGADVCIWLTKADYEAYAPAVQEAYEAARGAWEQTAAQRYGVSPRRQTAQGAGRVGVLEVSAFYYGLLGTDRLPRNNMEWLALPEERLAAAANGRVFADGAGEFLAFREGLLAYYPEDVRRKKMAARAAVMAQSGQYNYARCMRRGEYVAAELALAEFVRAACSLAYLLNRRYCPFYKWMHRGLKDLTVLSEIGDMLMLLTDVTDSKQKWKAEQADGRLLIVEAVCQVMAQELRAQGFTTTEDTYMEAHAVELTRGIGDEALRNLHILQG